MADGSAPIDANARAAAIVNRLWNDRSGVGDKIKAAAKELFPDVTIPADPVDEALAPLKEQITALQTTLAERDAKEAEAAQAALEKTAENELTSKLEAARKAFGLTDAGVEAVKARMLETKNFGSPEDAALYVLKDEKPVNTAGSGALGPQQVDFFGKQAGEDEERLKLLFSDPDGAFLDAEIAKMQADPADYVRKWAPQEGRLLAPEYFSQ